MILMLNAGEDWRIQIRAFDDEGNVQEVFGDVPKRGTLKETAKALHALADRLEGKFAEPEPDELVSPKPRGKKKS